MRFFCFEVLQSADLQPVEALYQSNLQFVVGLFRDILAGQLLKALGQMIGARSLGKGLF